jgi:hypothetical protein
MGGDDATLDLMNRNRPICSVCCGKGRRRTIDCPEDCTHFVAGARQAWDRLAVLSQDPEFEWKHAELLHNLRLAAVKLRAARMPDVADAEARQAFANAADTMRTRSSGLIYEHKSADMRIQLLSDALLLIAGYHEKGEKGFVRVDAIELASALRYLERQVKAMERLEKGAEAYLDLVCQAVGRSYAADKREPGLELPRVGPKKLEVK